MNKQLFPDQAIELLATLKKRFQKNANRHKNIDWADVEAKLHDNPDKLWILDTMEQTGGEPDVIEYGDKPDEYTFFDCAKESPKERRSLCYDTEALNARKEHKPADSAINMATTMGIELLDEEQYRHLQQFGDFDNTTSSWILTPEPIRKLGGSLFGDKRYNHVFVYHNGAQSYYAARGFRGLLRV